MASPPAMKWKPVGLTAFKAVLAVSLLGLRLAAATAGDE